MIRVPDEVLAAMFAFCFAGNLISCRENGRYGDAGPYFYTYCYYYYCRMVRGMEGCEEGKCNSIGLFRRHNGVTAHRRYLLNSSHRRQRK